MNSCLAGRCYGDPLSSWKWSDNPNGPTPGPKYDIYMKESAIRKPASVFVTIDEDPASINDAFFLVDEETGNGVVDLPGRQHNLGYGINFADGHGTIFTFKNKGAAVNWPGGGPPWKTGVWQEDWRQIHDNATYPWLP